MKGSLVQEEGLKENANRIITNDLPAIIDSSGEGASGTGDFDSDEGALVQQEAGGSNSRSTRTTTADGLPAIIDSGGTGVYGTANIDSGKSTFVQEEAVKSPASRIVANNLPVIIDPNGEGGQGRENL